MVRLLRRGNSTERLPQEAEMVEVPGRLSHSALLEGGCGNDPGTRTSSRPLDGQPVGWVLGLPDNVPKSRPTKDCGDANRDGQPSDMEMMKERFSKLLLGEDMSGGGKGVSSALALSNAITNLAASVFGEQRRLEPMPLSRKGRWRKEINWFLSVTDHIVEFVPSQQTASDGTSMEIMVTQQRKDLQMNIPALCKLDAMLIGHLDNFKDHNEFWYASKDEKGSEKGGAQRTDDKWWLPTVKVPPHGLSEVSKKWLQFQKESVNQVLKAAMAINAQVLMEMEIPEAYIQSLPKNGKASLGDSLYRNITDDHFDPDEFLASIDMSTEHKVLDLKNRIEASIVIWKRKMHNKDNKSSWGSAVSTERREQFEDRAETILLLIKQRFPGIPQSALDISKIQDNRDVGQAVLESYSRVLESLAFTVMSRIEDVLYADSLVGDPSQNNTNRRHSLSDSEPASVLKKLDPKEEMDKLNAIDQPNSMTLSDFMGWNVEHTEPETVNQEACILDTGWKTEETKLTKPPNFATEKKFSYIEKLENLGGFRSPTARH